MGQYKRTISSSHLDRSYIGIVKQVVDAKVAGRLKVWIPEFNTREDDETGWILCNYCSPYGGTTNKEHTSTTHYDLFDKTQTSYGFWGVPADTGNQVLVVFPSGDIGRALWIGCIYKEYMGQEVPGIASSDKNKQFTDTKHTIPVAEYNKWDKLTGDTADPLNPVRPYHKTRFHGIGEQGLLDDPIRGTTTSSSMRETPSQVMGISTPGPETKTTRNAREGGHTFVMDDGDEDGNDSYIGFRTKSGAYIRIDETDGIIYAINKKGTGWVQIDEDGNIDLFGAGSVSMRSQKDFNIRADGNVNIEAGQNVNIKAAQDSDATGKIVGEGNGIGGDVNIQSTNNLNITTDDDVYFTITKGNLEIDIAGSSTTHITGNDDVRIDGNSQTTIGGTTGTKSTNYNLDNSGNLEVAGTIHAGGNISSAGDVSSSLESLDALFQHAHGGVDTGPGTTAPFGVGGSSSTSTGPEAEQASQAIPIIINEHINVLSGFNGTVPMTLNDTATSTGNTVQITNYWERNTETMQTIVSRLMTFEPCRAHIKK